MVNVSHNPCIECANRAQPNTQTTLLNHNEPQSDVCIPEECQSTESDTNKVQSEELIVEDMENECTTHLDNAQSEQDEYENETIEVETTSSTTQVTINLSDPIIDGNNESSTQQTPEVLSLEEDNPNILSDADESNENRDPQETIQETTQEVSIEPQSEDSANEFIESKEHNEAVDQHVGEEGQKDSIFASNTAKSDDDGKARELLDSLLMQAELFAYRGIIHRDEKVISCVVSFIFNLDTFHLPN